MVAGAKKNGTRVYVGANNCTLRSSTWTNARLGNGVHMWDCLSPDNGTTDVTVLTYGGKPLGLHALALKHAARLLLQPF